MLETSWAGLDWMYGNKVLGHRLSLFLFQVESSILIGWEDSRPNLSLQLKSM
jgi:hypothetical protein